MRMRRSLGLMVLPLIRAETSKPNTGDQLQGFTFGYTTSNLVLPVISTCPTPLTISALNPTNAGGPDPIAPYTMVMFVHEQLMDGAGIAYERIYSRSMNVGDMSQSRQFQHPWMSGTQFIGCIWSQNGVSGGCQDLTTVVPSSETEAAYANATSVCRTTDVMASWVTNSSQTLDVSLEGISGTISQNAWPQSCSDLKFTAKNGTAPYTLVIAPAAHPPVNISSSSSSDNSMNYTIRLTHGQAFMAGVFDSSNPPNSWAVGPLHAGHSDQLACLAVKTGQETPGGGSGFSPGIGGFAGGIVGAFLVGALGALLLAWLYNRRKNGPARQSESQELLSDPYADPRPASYRMNSGTSSMHNKLVQPHTPPGGFYSDNTPVIGFDSPSTLYDPVSSPPRNAHGSGNSRPFPRPPTGESPYAEVGGYRDALNHSPNPDFYPSPNIGMSGTGSSGSHGQRDSFHSTSSRPHSAMPQQSYSGGGSGGARGRGKMGRMHAIGGHGSPTGEHEAEGDFEREEEERRLRNVYVVHSDGGGDVHIQLPQRANVIELPPNYRHEAPLRSPHSPPPTFIHSSRSLQSPEAAFSPPHVPLELTASRGSVPDVTAEELRARAEAALAEKGRPLSAQSVPRARQESPQDRHPSGLGQRPIERDL